MASKRTKYVIANAVNVAVELNEIIVTNSRKLQDSVIELPGLYDRAFLMYHEAGVIPVVDTLPEKEGV
jgi:hypothetical protein